MKRKNAIKYTVWGSLFLILLIFAGFAASEHRRMLCSQINVKIDTNGSRPLVTEKMIGALLDLPADSGIVLSSLDTDSLEARISSLPEVQKASVFVSITGQVNVKVVQHHLLARVVANNRSQLYITSDGNLIPSDNRFPQKLAIVSGHLEKYVANDLEENQGNIDPIFIELLELIQNDPFYSSLIDQIHIANDGALKLIPKVGRQVIEFGSTERMKEKLQSLSALYHAGFSGGLWSSYREINLKFENQIICSK